MDNPNEHLFTETDQKRSSEYHRLRVPTTMETLHTLETHPRDHFNLRRNNTTLQDRSILSNGKTAAQRRGAPKVDEN